MRIARFFMIKLYNDCFLSSSTPHQSPAVTAKELIEDQSLSSKEKPYHEKQTRIVGFCNISHSREKGLFFPYKNMIDQKENIMKQIKFGIFGLGRGGSFIGNILACGGEIVALCDKNEDLLK